MDGGSSDNFIHPALIKRLAVIVHRTLPFKVEVGDGTLLQCEGKVQRFPLNIQGHTLFVNAFVLSIANEKLVLGDIWLETLDTHLVNYKTKFITFFDNGKLVTLQGEVQSKDSMEPPMLTLPSDLNSELTLLIHDFADIFSIHRDLPPPCSHDHSIVLLPNVPPVKVRPYRYPYSQKTKIERMVKDMLAEGIIQPSTSPFSSPVLLVKKKYGSWQCCTDYRVLNAVTVKDSFPMPTIDELIDELFDTQFFSKFNLRSGYHQIRVVLVFFDDILVYSSDWSSHLRIALNNATVLALPDFFNQFVLEIDASRDGIRAILSQEAHKFVIRTDHKSLKEMQAQTIQTREQQLWLSKLLGYDFTIEYKKGSENKSADALSRSFLSLTMISGALLPRLRQELKAYTLAKELIEAEL
ncbi:uncharacterized protein [Arachis hypogaea]|uniref:uncharacterized protein n=1 Tax=Arachis hypogaea TaxID=3818 RepID=UPI003B2231E3